MQPGRLAEVVFALFRLEFYLALDVKDQIRVSIKRI